MSLLIVGCAHTPTSSLTSQSISSSGSSSVNMSSSSTSKNTTLFSSSSHSISSGKPSNSSLSSTNGPTVNISSSLTQSSESSLISSVSSVSSSNENTNVSIKEIKEKAKWFVGKENSVGVYESDIYVSLDLQIIACLDAITTKTGYGDRYKILMSDGKDYIYVKTTQKNYQYLEKYVVNKGVYRVEGNISLYNNEVEITMKNDISYLENKSINIDYESFAINCSLQEVYSLMENMKLNTKGVGFSKVVKIKVKCLAKDINNTNLYFGNGDYIINVHGHNKITNSFVVGNSYTLFGALNVYNFRPGLEYVYHSSLNENIEINTSNLSKMKTSDFYKYTYEVDKNSTYPSYSKLFETPFVVEGYANSYLKDGKEYIVLDDEYKENYYNAYTNARDGKAIFFVNENYQKLISTNTQYCPVYEHIELGSKLRVVVFPYLWNTQKYPQVYCYSFEILDD